MRGPSAALLPLLALLLCTATSVCFGLHFRNSEVRCIEEERQALLKFKRGLEDEDGLLSSWGSQEEDCCNWKGIKCSNRTAHVAKLDLRADVYSEPHKYLRGEINSSLLGLQHLTYLDLSCNLFSILPEFIGSLTKLQYLNLSYNSFSGTISPQLGNLSSLISLDLSGIDFSQMLIEDHNLDWLFNLSSLRHLDMSHVNLSKVVNWPDKFNMLPSLLHLSLSACGLSMPLPPMLSNANSSSRLSFLDLSYNNFNSSVFPWLFKYTNSLVFLDLYLNNLEGSIPRAFGNMVALVHLDLSYNHNLEGSIPRAFGNMVALVHLDLAGNNLEGSIPRAFGNMVALVHLDLSGNNLEGSIPRAFGNMVALVHLDLSHNKLDGAIPQTLENLHNLQVLDLSYNNISGEVPDLSKFPLLRELFLYNNRLNGTLTKGIMGKLSKLQFLDVSSNLLEGDVTEAHLSNLSNLYLLDFSSTSLSLKFSPAWVPPFHLDTITLGSCNLGPAFPQWLQALKNFSRLDISDARISDTIPNWFWDLSSRIQLLNLSHNHITGTIPLQWFSARFTDNHVIDLSYNHLSGPLPQFHSNSSVLNLSNNLFQGSITSICKTTVTLSYLDLSNNLLFGELPNCWGKMLNIVMLNLASNNFSGRIPNFVCGSTREISYSQQRLETLHLQNNSFIGELPKSLKNCSSLKLLDLGENKLSGRIPTWLGTSLPHLVVLRLSSNLFVGHIPLQLCHLTSLQILYLSHNNIRGTIPKCLNNFTVMAQTQGSNVSISHGYAILVASQVYSFSTYTDNLLVVFKEKYLEYSKTLGLVKLIDLSSNKLKGEIPKEITSLSGLIVLNLSRNLLTGTIPYNIGDMERLESLDLSKNHISGRIPPSLVDLSFLSNLILSNNNLSGRIPTGTQLQSFSASAYIGNQDLCGLPLLKMCPGDEVAQIPQTSSIDRESNNQEHTNSHEHLWFYTSIVLGFIVGFWSVCGSLMLKSSWRHAYFQYLERIGDWLYVKIAISMAKLLRK